jgi:hypothetical protein
MSSARAILVLICLAAVVAACAPLPATPSAPAASAVPNIQPTVTFAVMELPKEQPIAVTPAAPAGQPTGEAACAGLDSALSQIVSSSNPVDAAKQMQIPVKNGDKIQVVLTLESPDTAFLTAFGAEIGSQSGNSVQVYVPIGRLCELANTQQVSAIKLPASAVTQ